MLERILGCAENAVVWMLLWPMRWSHINWQNIVQRRLVGEESAGRIEVEGVSSDNLKRLLEHMLEREKELWAHRTFTQDKLKNLLTISTSLFVAAVALAKTQAIASGALFLALPFGFCSFLIIHYIKDDGWKSFAVSTEDLQKTNNDSDWVKLRVVELDKIWQHNEEVRGFLMDIYAAARWYFLLGLFLTVTAVLAQWATGAFSKSKDARVDPAEERDREPPAAAIDNETQSVNVEPAGSKPDEQVDEPVPSKIDSGVFLDDPSAWCRDGITSSICGEPRTYVIEPHRTEP